MIVHSDSVSSMDGLGMARLCLTFVEMSSVIFTIVEPGDLADLTKSAFFKRSYKQTITVRNSACIFYHCRRGRGRCDRLSGRCGRVWLFPPPPPPQFPIKKSPKLSLRAFESSRMLITAFGETE
jgi:hypothetical protein